MSTTGSQPPSHEITSESLFLRRREFLKNGALVAGTAFAVGSGLLWLVGAAPPPDVPEEPAVAVPVAEIPAPSGPATYTVDEAQTPYQSVTTYNNFYEFG